MSLAVLSDCYSTVDNMGVKVVIMIKLKIINFCQNLIKFYQCETTLIALRQCSIVFFLMLLYAGFWSVKKFLIE